MSAPEKDWRAILCKLLGVSPDISEQDLLVAIERRLKESAKINQLDSAARELETAAKVAAKSGMYETGAAMRNKASGIRHAVKILTTGGAL